MNQLTDSAKINKKNDCLYAMHEIRQKFSMIENSDIEAFAPIYYPVAIVEILFDEKTFEDFDTVQLAVFRLYALGIKDYTTISDLLGLSSLYVSKILNLLLNIGLIDNQGITQIGQESLDEKKKITVSKRIAQRCQVDALNGCLIKIENTISSNVLNETSLTNVNIAHLNYLDGIKEETVNSQLKNQDYSDFISHNSGILNSNIMDIHEVKCVEIKYAKCYILKDSKAADPIIFAKRYNPGKKDLNERFTWQPFSVGVESDKQRYGLPDEIPISNNLSRQYVKNAYHMISELGFGINIEEQALYTLRRVYKFERETLIMEGIVGKHFVIKVNEKSFRKYRAFVGDFLLEIQENGCYLFTDYYLFGKILSVKTDSNRLLAVATLLKNKIESTEKSKVFGILREKLWDFEGEADRLLIDEIEVVLTEN